MLQPKGCERRHIIEDNGALGLGTKKMVRKKKGGGGLDKRLVAGWIKRGREAERRGGRWREFD